VLSLEVPEQLKNSPALDVLRRSDHASFWSRDWPSAMLTDTAEFRNPRYHCRDGVDSMETVKPEFALQIVKATVATAATLADASERLTPLANASMPSSRHSGRAVQTLTELEKAHSEDAPFMRAQ
jgi:hypothetical protein